MGVVDGPHLAMHFKGIKKRVKATNGLVFSSVRHPYDRAVSLFYWFNGLNNVPGKRRRPEHVILCNWARSTDINTFWSRVDIKWINRGTRMFRPQTWFLKDNPEDGTLSENIDNLLRFETLEEDWARIRCLSEESYKPLPHQNKSVRKTVDEELTQETKNLLLFIYEEDFRLLNYTP